MKNRYSMNRIKIAIADDYSVYRDGLRVAISADNSLEVILEAANGDELLKKIETDQPELIIMDYKMPVMDGMEATKMVKLNYPNIKVLVISMYEDAKFVRHLTDNGADGYLLKNAEPEEIRHLIHELCGR